MANILLTGCLVLSCVFIQGTYGMDCTLGTSENALDKFIHSCPRIIVDSADESYCCYKYTDDGKISARCCTFWDFIVSNVGNLLLPIVIIVLVVLFLTSCICCLCCKKSRGGRVLQPPPTMVVNGPPYVSFPAGASTNPQHVAQGYRY